MNDEFLAATEASIAAWHGIHVPNDAGRRLAADLANTIRAFEAQRARLAVRGRAELVRGGAAGLQGMSAPNE